MRARNYLIYDVFTGERLSGNPLAIVLDCEGLDTRAMQRTAREFNLSESVFMLPPENPKHRARIRIFTPAKELPFAGHPSVGTAWWLAESRTPVGILREKAGDVTVTVDEEAGTASIDARAEWTPAFEWLPLESPADVDALDPLAFTEGQHYAYAWIDEQAGHLSTFCRVNDAYHYAARLEDFDQYRGIRLAIEAGAQILITEQLP